MIPIKSKLTKKAVILLSSIFLLEVLYIGLFAGFIDNLSSKVESERQATKVVRAVADTESRGASFLTDLFNHFMDAIHYVVNAKKYKHKNFAHDQFTADQSYSALPKSVAQLDKAIGNNESPAREKFRTVREICTVNVQAISKRLLKLHDRISDIMRLEREMESLYENLSDIAAYYEGLENDAGGDLEKLSNILLWVAIILGLMLNAGIAVALYNTFISGFTNRLERITNDLATISSGKTVSAPTRSSSDEIDDLAEQLYTMASNVQQFHSNEKVLLDNAASVICSIDSNGRITSISPGSAAQIGFTREELLGTYFTELTLNQGEAVEVAQELEKLFEEQVDVEFETQIKKRNVMPSSEKRSQETSALLEFSWKARLSERGDTAVLVGHDVTERNRTISLIKQTQEEFRDIVDRMPIAVATADEFFTIKSLNTATGKMFKRSPTNLLSRNLSVLLTGDTVGGAQLNEIVKVAQERPLELTVKDAYDEPFPVEFSVRAYTSAERKTYLATFRDISVRTEIERVKRDFVSMISHDLRSPLTALFGTLEMMVEEAAIRKENAELPLPSESTSELRRANAIVSNLVNLINDFLDLEKFEAGMGVLDLVTIPLGELVDETLACPQLDVLPIAVSPDRMDPNILVKVDRDRFTFALTNLILLVRQQTERSTNLRLWLAVDAPFATITITCDGYALPEHVKEKLLSRYSFVPTISDQITGASGLALALSRAIIQNHNGQLSFDNDGVVESITISLRLA